MLLKKWITRTRRMISVRILPEEKRFLKRRIILCVLLGCGWTAAAAQDEPVYKDRTQPVEKRVADLLDRMTLQEKIAQLSHLHGHQLYSDREVDREKLREAAGTVGCGCVEGFNLTGVQARKAFHIIQRYMVEQTRLGIPALTVTESLHGSVHDGSTIFPQSVAVGSTFNTELAYRMTRCIAGELRSQGVSQTLSPGLDVVRDLRWGRAEESFGEDPWLVGQMGIAQVNGYLDGGVSPMLKPFGPGGSPVGGLNLASVECGERDLRTIHIKPYEMAVKNTAVKAVMSSYNSWNGVPNSASFYLLTEILRNEWGFRGYVYSDWGAVSMLKDFQHTAASEGEAAVQALTAGLDLEASGHCFRALEEWVKQGKLDIHYIDRAVARVLRVKFESGLFESPYPGADLPGVRMRTPEAVALSRSIADEAIVLLKNEGELLPLDPDKIRSLAVIGPNAGRVQFGDYTWSRDNADGVTPLEGLENLIGNRVKINYAPGCDLVTNDTSGFAAAVRAAEASDAAVVFVGSASASLARDYSGATCGEGFDLSSLDLTGVQEELVKQVYATGKPVVVVLVTGKPFAVPWIKDHIPAVAVQWYGGEKAGDAIAAMLTGKTNPSARLPFSFPRSVGHLPVYYNHLPTDKGFYRRPGRPGHPGRDYVFSSPDPLWAFGYGLSYTVFEYVDARLSSVSLHPSDTLTVQVTLKNTGGRDGKEVVQVYIRDVAGSVVTPVRQLKAFAKPFLKAGETQTVALKLPVQEWALYDLKMQRVVEAGEFEIQVGSASDDIRWRQTVTVDATADKTRSPEAAVRCPPAAVRAVADTTCVAVSGSTDEVSGISEPSGREFEVTGCVRDVQAAPVGGIEIRSEYSGRKTTTAKDGKYTLRTVYNDVLVVSADGFETIRIPVNGKKVIDIQLNYRHE